MAQRPHGASRCEHEPAIEGSADPLERRITELEIRVCYQEDTIEKLNQMIIRQQAHIDRLERHLADVVEQVPLGAGRDRMPPDEPPPHW